MAKKETKNAASAAPANPAAPAAKPTPAAPAVKKPFGKEPNGNDVFIRVMNGKEGAPLTHKNAKGETVPCTTPQVKVIANLLEASPNNRLTRKELVAQLPAAGLVTRQPVGRIVSYYQKPMVDDGIITIEKAPATVAAPAAA